jgi:hypothetical protein
MDDGIWRHCSGVPACDLPTHVLPGFTARACAAMEAQFASRRSNAVCAGITLNCVCVWGGGFAPSWSLEEINFFFLKSQDALKVGGPCLRIGVDARRVGTQRLHLGARRLYFPRDLVKYKTCCFLATDPSLLPPLPSYCAVRPVQSLPRAPSHSSHNLPLLLAATLFYPMPASP